MVIKPEFVWSEIQKKI